MPKHFGMIKQKGKGDCGDKDLASQIDRAIFMGQDQTAKIPVFDVASSSHMGNAILLYAHGWIVYGICEF